MATLPDLLAAFLARWNAHDADGVVALYADDAEMVDPTLATPIRGPGALREYYRSMWVTIPDARLECTCAESDGQAIACAWRFSGTGPAGRWSVIGTSFFALRGGLIARDHAVWDPSSAG